MQNIAMPAGRGRVERDTASTWELGRGADWSADDGSALRGIALGVVLGGAAWCGIGLLVWFLL
jgi:hypothetical protein